MRFSNVPKTLRARKLPRKAPENVFSCFSKRTKISDPKKVTSFSPEKLREVTSSRKAFSGFFFINKMAFLVRNREARVFMKRTELEGMREREVIERYRLSSRRIQWLITEFHNQLDRETERNCPLSPETQVSGLEIKTLI